MPLPATLPVQHLPSSDRNDSSCSAAVDPYAETAALLIFETLLPHVYPENRPETVQETLQSRKAHHTEKHPSEQSATLHCCKTGVHASRPARQSLSPYHKSTFRSCKYTFLSSAAFPSVIKSAVLCFASFFLFRQKCHRQPDQNNLLYRHPPCPNASICLSTLPMVSSANIPGIHSRLHRTGFCFLRPIRNMEYPSALMTLFHSHATVLCAHSCFLHRELPEASAALLYFQAPPDAAM